VDALSGLSVEALGTGGVIVAVVVAFVLWKLVKLAFKVALLVAIVIALTLGVGAYVKGGRAGLPVPKSGATGAR
jgi:hypothetical protein